MSYRYEALKPGLFTEDNQRMFLSIRDRVQKLLREAGAVRLQEAINQEAGDSWTMLACVDRLVEIGELREVTTGQQVAGQHRVFVAA